ncbi:MAG: hypothetical protein U0361_17960 [Nitrospiraceae bacterium]
MLPLSVLAQVDLYGLMSDEAAATCAFAELQMFGKDSRGSISEFFRFAYGAFSKDLDNDLDSAPAEGANRKISAFPDREGRGVAAVAERD